MSRGIERTGAVTKFRPLNYAHDRPPISDALRRGADEFILIAENDTNTARVVSKQPRVIAEFSPKNKSFDIGFPAVYQKGTSVKMKITREKKAYGGSPPKDAWVIRWTLSRPALGLYKIVADIGLWEGLKYKLKIKKDIDIKYKMYPVGGDPVVIFPDKLILTSVAFSIIELMLFDGDELPSLVLRNKSAKDKWAIWQQLKDKALCMSRKGLWFEKSKTCGDGWCRFWKIEDVANKSLYKYLNGHKVFGGVVKEAREETDPQKKLLIMGDIVNKILKIPYGISCAEDKRRGTCWSPKDLKAMRKGAIIYKNKLPEESGF